MKRNETKQDEYGNCFICDFSMRAIRLCRVQPCSSFLSHSLFSILYAITMLTQSILLYCSELILFWEWAERLENVERVQCMRNLRFIYRKTLIYWTILMWLYLYKYFVYICVFVYACVLRGACECYYAPFCRLYIDNDIRWCCYT